MVTKDGIDIESALDMDEATEADVVARAKDLGADYVTVDAHGMAGFFKKGRKFERIRRVSGYLSPLNRWNSAKRAEEHDRVKHGLMKDMAATTLVLSAMSALALVSACVTEPDTGDVRITIPSKAIDAATNAIARAVERAEKRDDKPSDSTASEAENDESASGNGKQKAKEPETTDASSFSAEWRYGGFDGSRAKEVAGCRISSLKIGGDGMSYKWVSGGCEALGASGRDDWSHTVACMAYWDGSKWVAGKFDWISTSRTTRSFENIKDGYGGWNANAFFSAKRHGFCIVSSDGRKRSNFIESE